MFGHCLRELFCGERRHHCGCHRPRHCGWRQIPCEREEERRPKRVCRCEMRCRWEERREERREHRCGCHRHEERQHEGRECGRGEREEHGRHGEWNKCCFESHGEF
ncbi:MAG: hypothetical protein FWE31_02775 [Firmicutes bacterium]|nr:hypothetical protein [Bacillota bacterium]